jgi:hypothetical protein
MVLAEPLEDQLVEWLRDFRPDSELRSLVVDAIHAAARERAGDEPERGREICSPASTDCRTSTSGAT